MRKDPNEIEALRNAAHGVDRVMARIPEEVEFGGRTERDVSRHLREMTIEEGHDVAEFAIVAGTLPGMTPMTLPNTSTFGFRRQSSRSMHC